MTIMRFFRTLPLLAIVALALGRAHAASVKISDLPAITAPSTNTWIEVADMDATPKSRKYLLSDIGNFWTNSNNTLEPLFYYTNYAIGQQALLNPSLDNGTNIYAFGLEAGSGLAATNSSNIYLVGNRVGKNAILTNAASVFAYGTADLESGSIDGGHDYYFSGDHAAYQSVIKGASGPIWMNGYYAGQQSIIEASGTLFFDGTFAGSLSRITNSSAVFLRGTSSGTGAVISGSTAIILDGYFAGESSSMTNSRYVTSISGLSHAHLTNAFGLTTIGFGAGTNLAGAFTNVVLIGDLATASDGDANLVALGANMTLQTPVLRAVKAIRQYQGTLTHAGTVTLDFDGSYTDNTISLTGNVTFAFSNVATNRSFQLMVKNNQATNCTITWPSGIHGYYTTTISNATWMAASMKAFGTGDTNVWLSTSSDGTY